MVGPVFGDSGNYYVDKYSVIIVVNSIRCILCQNSGFLYFCVFLVVFTFILDLFHFRNSGGFFNFRPGGRLPSCFPLGQATIWETTLWWIFLLSVVWQVHKFLPHVGFIQFLIQALKPGSSHNLRNHTLPVNVSSLLLFTVFCPFIQFSIQASAQARVIPQVVIAVTTLMRKAWIKHGCLGTWGHSIIW